MSEGFDTGLDTFFGALKVVESGFETWKSKEHNRKWFRMIDGTPIPNDLCVVIAEAVRDAAMAERNE